MIYVEFNGRGPVPARPPERGAYKRPDAGCTLHWEIVLPETRLHDGGLVSPVESLERYFRDRRYDNPPGGVRAFLLRPPGQGPAEYAAVPGPGETQPGALPQARQGCSRHLAGAGSQARRQLEGPTGLGALYRTPDRARFRLRRSPRLGTPLGSGRVHRPGWNLCYMPFWAGMLTERQHPHPELEMAVRQAAWDLYFRADPVCDPPDFVTDPGIDLDALLDGQPILLLLGGNAPTGRRSLHADASGDEIDAHIREVRKITNQNWSNLRKAVLSLQGKPHEPFGTGNVESTAQSVVRRIGRETGVDLAGLEERLNAVRR